MSEGQIARSGPKILGYGGGTRVRWGGSPPIPPMSDNPAETSNSWVQLHSNAHCGFPPIPPMSDNPARKVHEVSFFLGGGGTIWFIRVVKILGMGGMRNSQWISVMGSRKHQSVSVMVFRNRQWVSVIVYYRDRLTLSQVRYGDWLTLSEAHFGNWQTLSQAC